MPDQPTPTTPILTEREAIEARARELLAVEYDRIKRPLTAKAIRSGMPDGLDAAALRAIEASLSHRLTTEGGLREALEPFAREAERNGWTEEHDRYSWNGSGLSYGDFRRASLALASSPPSSEADCERCQGNGEIVVDWERYKHAREGDVGDEAVAECPDCFGTGKVEAPTPSAVLDENGRNAVLEDRADAERWRALLSSDRIRMMGCAGIDYADNEAKVREPSNGIHLGVEIWDKHPAAGDPCDTRGRKILRAYVDYLRSLKSPPLTGAERHGR